MSAELLILGLMAGAVTTVAGVGGGMLMTLALSLLEGPTWAVAVTAPALLLGNVHRAWLFRSHLEPGIAKRFMLGGVPGALLGGWLAAGMPASWAQILLAVVTALSALKPLLKLKFQIPAAAFVPAGVVIGAVTGASGGAALLAAPLFLAAGLHGPRYIATVSLCAASLHLARIGGYSAGGLLDRSTLLASLLLALAIFAGNGLGRWLRRFSERLPQSLLEYAMLGACVVLSLFGLG